MAQAQVLAVFPVALVRESLKMKRGGFRSHSLAEKFGYIHARKMAPAVIYAEKNLSFVHCGSEPLKAVCNVSGLNRWTWGRSAYISESGKHVYPC